MFRAGADDKDANSSNINFTIMSFTLSARVNQKLSKLLNKEFERSIYWNEYKTKTENENMRNQYRYFLE